MRETGASPKLWKGENGRFDPLPSSPLRFLGGQFFPPKAALFNSLLRSRAVPSRPRGLSGQGRRRHLRNRDCGRRILPQGILPARLAGTQDFQCLFARVLTADSQCVEALLADAGDHLPDLLDHGLGDLLHGFGEPLEGVPDLDNELACQSRHHKRDLALSAQQLAAPVAVGVVGGAQQRMARLDKERAEVLVAMPLDAAAPGALAAVVEGGVESGVLDEGLVGLESVDIADDGSDGEGDDVADAAESGEFEELWILEDLLRGEAGQAAVILLLGMARFASLMKTPVH